jgi:hypothetical protein
MENNDTITLVDYTFHLNVDGTIQVHNNELNCDEATEMNIQVPEFVLLMNGFNSEIQQRFKSSVENLRHAAFSASITEMLEQARNLSMVAEQLIPEQLEYVKILLQLLKNVKLYNLDSVKDILVYNLGEFLKAIMLSSIVSQADVFKQIIERMEITRPIEHFPFYSFIHPVLYDILTNTIVIMQATVADETSAKHISEYAENMATYFSEILNNQRQIAEHLNVIKTTSGHSNGNFSS